MQKEPYLIQRGSFKRGASLESAKGIDAIVKMDYMGSAEFEFGAMPAALKQMGNDWSEYTITELDDVVSRAGERLFVLHRKSQDFVLDWVRKISDDRHAFHLKEGCDLAFHLMEKPPYESRNDFWWDIDEGLEWMAVFGQEHADLLREAMNNLYERWGAEGKVKKHPRI